ncbi:MAG: hypothetical protein KQJ78_19680 [Deltaproteobacteria bacterium]|nr:hypothetical protein [Deltaproteobacteria bacterium]
MELTAQDQGGATIFQTQRIYMPQCSDSLEPLMVVGPDKKLGILRDTSLQPFAPKREEFEIRLAAPTPAVRLNLRLTYELRPGDGIVIHDWQKTVAVGELFPTNAGK